jgi:hypothetical protein
MAFQRYKTLGICTGLLLLNLCVLRGYAQSGDSGRIAPVGQAPGSVSLSDSGKTPTGQASLDSLARVARRHRRDSLARVARLQALQDSVGRSRALLDSARSQALSDSVAKAHIIQDSLARHDSLAKAAMMAARPPKGPTAVASNTRAGTPKIRLSKDLLFYVILCMFLWVGILKSGYEKYYSDLFTVFFRSSLRQHQIREQLLQARLPSLLFNLFFIGSAGTFLYLLASGHSIRIGHAEWQLWVASVGAVAFLYSAKFVGLKLSGWIFGMGGAADTYIFIVFLVNKILGVALLPVLILLAFSKEPLSSIGATLGILLVVGMLVYRFVRSYRPVWEEVQMSRFHFFLYLCAFEIAPLLLIYKTMLKLL